MYHMVDSIIKHKSDMKWKHRYLTVLCPGMIFETQANFKLLSPLLEIQIKDDSS